MRFRLKISKKAIAIIVTTICIVTIIVSIKFKGRMSILEGVFGYGVTPIQKGIASVGDWFSERVDSIKKLKDLQKDNVLLKEELNKLKFENNVLKQDKFELDRLRELYKLDKKYAEYPKIGAQVIAKSPGNWFKTFTIDKGSIDGLKPFMIVMANTGLVGHITEVGPNYSKVQSIIDDTSNVSSKVLRTADTFFVSGDMELTEKGLCKIEFISDEAEIMVGDEVVTSSLGDIYPPGILIGKIRSIDKQAHALTKYAYLEPVVDFKHLEEVLVINKLWKEEIDMGGKK